MPLERTMPVKFGLEWEKKKTAEAHAHLEGCGNSPFPFTDNGGRFEELIKAEEKRGKRSNVNKKAADREGRGSRKKEWGGANGYIKN